MGRHKRNPVPVSDLRWITPSLDEIIAAEEVTLWGAIAAVMGRLSVDEKLIEAYLEAINEAECSLVGDDEVLFCREDTDVASEQAVRQADALVRKEFSENSDWIADFYGDKSRIWMRREDAVEALSALEFERFEAIVDLQLPAMIYHALKSDIESSRPSFKHSTVLGLAYRSERTTILLKQTQLGKDGRFFESHVGKVLRLAVSKPVEVKVHNSSPEYQLIGVFASILTGMFPREFQINNRANANRLVEFIESNIDSDEQQDFRQERTLKSQIERGLKASKDLRTVSRRVMFGEKLLREEGISVEKYLIDISPKNIKPGQSK